MTNCSEREGHRPLVTVIIPTYKRPDRVGAAIESVIGQTYDNIEIIVVDDNKKAYKEYEATQDTLKPYIESGKVRVVQTGGIGGGGARNYGAAQATGEYLAFLDDDDIFMPDKIETQLKFMVDNNLDMSYQDISWYDYRTGKLVEHRRLNHVKDFSRIGLLKAHLVTPIAPTAIYMIRTEAFLSTEGFGEVPVGQDWFLMLRCIEAGMKIGYMPEVHVHQFLYPGERLSLGKNKVVGENRLYQVRKKYYNILSRKERKYIDFRHYAVLAFASQRSKKSVNAVKYALQAFFASPSDFIKKIPEYFGSAKN